MLEVRGADCRSSDILVCSGDQSAQSAEKFFAFIFQLSGWAFMAPSCFVLMHQDQCCKVAEDRVSSVHLQRFFSPEQNRLSYDYINS